MKLDTSSYYPKSPLDDEPDPDHAAYMPGHSAYMPGHASEPEREGSDQPSSESHEQPELPESQEFPESQEQPESRVEITDSRGAVQFQAEGADSPRSPEPQSTPDLPPTRWEQLVDNLSTAVSWLMSPLLMPVYGIVLVFMLTLYSYVPMGVKLGFTLIVAGVTIILPMLTVLLLKHLGMVSEIGLNNQKERTLPYLITILCMGGTGVFLAIKGFPLWVVMFYAGGALAGLIEAIINNWWKISAHAAGVAGLVAMLVRMSHTPMVNPDVLTWLIVAVACAGLTGSARLWLGRHTLGQVLAGYAVGFCSVYFLTMI